MALGKRKPIAAKPSKKMAESEAYGFALIVPAAEVAPTMAELLLHQTCPFAILMPSDLVHVIQCRTPEAKKRRGRETPRLRENKKIGYEHALREKGAHF